MTGSRFRDYTRDEDEVFHRFLEEYDDIPGFEGIFDALSDYSVHPSGAQEYDIRVSTPKGRLLVEIQQSTRFDHYGDVRLDYVAAFLPADFKCSTLKQFEEARQSGQVEVSKWGKIADPQAHLLVVKFYNGDDPFHIYSLAAIRSILPQLERIGRFRINDKGVGERWGSAFLAIRHSEPALQATSPKSLEEVLALLDKE